MDLSSREISIGVGDEVTATARVVMVIVTIRANLIFIYFVYLYYSEDKFSDMMNCSRQECDQLSI